MPGFADSLPDPAALHAAVDAELAVDVYELNAEQLGHRCLVLRAERDRLEVAIASTDAVFERTRAYARLDPSCTKASQWLAKQLHTPVAVARKAYRHARRLCLLPGVRDAVIGGVVSGWHATRLTNACANIVRARQMAINETDFITMAGELSGREFDSGVRYWTETHFGEEIDGKAAAADQARHVACHAPSAASSP